MTPLYDDGDMPEMTEQRTDAIRETLLTQVRTEASRRRRALRRRFALWGGIGVLAIGGAATAATAILHSQEVTNTDIVYCLASPQRGADGQFTYAAATLHDEASGEGTVSDPIGVCRDMWRRGALDKDTDQLAATPGPHEVPKELQLCVMGDGSPAVVPGRPGICQSAGLAPER
ncbi:hypothetical protein P5G50_00525 [Leifsonia sp. F6_8S_P_1B]|uniref:Uncharacterized protein n=1 Tax=Leifsonia williamsii TaxID=3035919 RepID=A0ABT8K689_9MICO|nr:hypothetical protein [Leifsonia williamsii]MDN4612919.1 hypothetical protein [Leifsonia williamsii]